SPPPARARSSTTTGRRRAERPRPRRRPARERPRPRSPGAVRWPGCAPARSGPAAAPPGCRWSGCARRARSRDRRLLWKSSHTFFGRGGIRRLLGHQAGAVAQADQLVVLVVAAVLEPHDPGIAAAAGFPLVPDRRLRAQRVAVEDRPRE